MSSLSLPTLISLIVVALAFDFLNGLFTKDTGASEEVPHFRRQGERQAAGFDALHKSAARREFDVVMAWSVDRLGRSLQDLVGFLSEIHAAGVDVFLHQRDARCLR